MKINLTVETAKFPEIEVTTNVEGTEKYAKYNFYDHIDNKSKFFAALDDCLNNAIMMAMRQVREYDATVCNIYDEE